MNEPTTIPTAKEQTFLKDIVSGAWHGALLAPVFAVLYILCSAPLEILANIDKFWSIESLRTSISLLVSTSVGGAAIGASRHVIPIRDWLFFVIALPIAGGIAGSTFWLIERPTENLWLAVLVGIGVGVAVIVQWGIEELVSRTPAAPSPPAPTFTETGSPIECPRCSQRTNNIAFCEICGFDRRKEKPEIIGPD